MLLNLLESCEVAFGYALQFFKLENLAYLRCTCTVLRDNPLVLKTIENKEGKEGRFLQHYIDSCERLGKRISMLKEFDFLWQKVKSDEQNDLRLSTPYEWMSLMIIKYSPSGMARHIAPRYVSSDYVFKSIYVESEYPIELSIGGHIQNIRLPPGSYEKELFSVYINPNVDLCFHDIWFETIPPGKDFTLELKAHRYTPSIRTPRFLAFWFCNEYPMWAVDGVLQLIYWDRKMMVTKKDAWKTRVKWGIHFVQF